MVGWNTPQAPAMLPCTNSQSTTAHGAGTGV
jgi:hypothetical protein